MAELVEGARLLIAYRVLSSILGSNPSLSALFLLLILCFPLAAAAEETDPCKKNLESSTKKIAKGVLLHRQQCEDPPYKAYILEVDLTSKKIGFFVTPYKKRLLLTSKFAETFEAVAAVNGGFWSDRAGFTVSGGELWPKYPDTEEGTVITFGDRDEKSGKIPVDIRPPEEILEEIPAGAMQALSGIPLILDGGEPLKNEEEIFRTRHPRTGAGTTEDGKTLFIAVVDGRQKGWSLGLSTLKFGRLFKSLGAWRAVNLDGGQSSTMVVPSMGGVVNRPCYKKGPERPVPNHLAIVKIKPGVAAALLGGPRGILELLRWG